ncbi:MAG: bifunctional (p)ppGpp synthetase/guanosine-3',5'-bis(diphosphate) 3'-pyrophosphohydrolase [Spirochaetes bacterium]|nr:bifunctional (p)ppGpp synthetase/guanosine-3',5'-bis(diphosphate) 3'-pyrophosphohydrolase [Spirochaetota bacterium]
MPIEDNTKNFKPNEKDPELLISHLKSVILEKDPDADIDTIDKAYKFAYDSHKNQLRLSGEPYITHPLQVAIILANLNLDITTITAALLHDVIEDTKTNFDIIKNKFSEETAVLVDGVTKISSLKKKTKYDEAHNLRKMLLATINDIRVILIKLADKLHNMRTIRYQNPDKQKQIAGEVLDIYAPLANRLGISQIASEISDIAFEIIYPEEYSEIVTKITHNRDEIEKYIINIQEILNKRFKELGIKAEITGRAKHYYSIFQKMEKQNKSLKDIFDIRAVRIITDELKDCYGILGVIHTLWSPISSRFKDYIAVPKSNMYQSIHTTVIGPQGHPLEIQIRTREMHITAEIGIAAHWLYKENPKTKSREYKEITLLKNIQKRQFVNDRPKDFLKELKMDLYTDEIFTFTPRGKIIKLAKGATPVDFAYAIHTEIGHHCIGAKVNNKIVPLKSELNSGDIVEIRTGNKEHPSESWLKFVKSSNARYKIRNWLRKNKDSNPNIEKDQKEQKTIEVSIPNNELFKIKDYSGRNKQNLFIDGTSNILIKLSQCCQPIPGDEVVGFITRGRGLTVHKKTCPSLLRLKAEKERFINIVWKGSIDTFPVKIAVHAIDRKNLLKDIAEKISAAKTNIIRMEADAKEKDNVIFKFILEVTSTDHLSELMKLLKNIKNITKVYKINEKVQLKHKE